jgi:hypothetical protein
MNTLSHALLEKLQQDYGIQTFTVLSHLGNTVQGQGTQLVQLNRSELGQLSGVYVEIPIDLSLETSDERTLNKVQVQKIAEEDIEEAVSHIQRLARRGQIESVSQAASKATHAIETDRMGRKILVRSRYS